MRFILNFELDIVRLPIEIRRTVISFFKKSLTETHNSKYYPQFFTGTQIKDYSFSVIFPLDKYFGEEIYLKRPEMKVVVSCSEKNNIGFLLVNVFLSQRNKKFPLPKDTHMILKDVRIIEEKVIREEEAVFQTTIGGGVVVREHNKEENKDIYYSVGNERFEEVLNWLMKERFKRLGYPEDIFKDFSCELLDGRKIVVKHFDLKFPVTTGKFKVKAPKILLEEIYRTGMGSRLSQGFGLLEYLGGEIKDEV